MVRVTGDVDAKVCVHGGRKCKGVWGMTGDVESAWVTGDVENATSEATLTTDASQQILLGLADPRPHRQQTQNKSSSSSSSLGLAHGRAHRQHLGSLPESTLLGLKAKGGEQAIVGP